MKRSLQRYGVHFAAVLVVIVLGVAAGGYVLANQRFYLPHWVPVVGSDFVDYHADFKSAKAVVPGQGQTVAISGVTVGEIGSVSLVNGRGRVTMKIRRKYAGRIHTDATAALRPRTPLDDMIIQLDPGTKTAPVLKEGGLIPSAQTMTPVEFDEILSTFDGDTLAYLAILLQQGATGLQGEGGARLSSVLKRFEPTTVYVARIAKALKSRNAVAARAVTNLEKVTAALGKNQDALSTFVSSGADAFQAISERQSDLAQVLKKAPAALKATGDVLTAAGSISTNLARSSRKLERPSAKLDAGLRDLTTLMNTSTPVIKNSLRPFARDVQGPLGRLKPAVDDLASSGGNVATGTTTLRQLFDGLAYEPSGGDFSALTLAGYIGHAGMSLTSAQDAAGAVTRTLLYTDCDLVNVGLGLIRNQSPYARVISDFLGAPRPTTVLPNGQTAKQFCDAQRQAGG